MSQDEAARKLAEIRALNKRKQLLERREVLKEGLPHLYGFKWYEWAWDFFQSRNKINLLVAGNQLSKSSSQIRKCIEWAGNPQLWPDLFKMRKPIQFWMLYPTRDMVNLEFNTKWVPEFMPRGEFKEHVSYGWEVVTVGRDVEAVKFNSGVTVHFKTYAQNATALQASTVDAIFCFTGDNLVTTSTGLKKIKNVQVGDKVMTKEGNYCPVVETYSREQIVIKRIFSNGEIIEATPDHKFWTNKGWVEFQNLTSSDVIVIHNSCEDWEQQKLLFLKEDVIQGIQKAITVLTNILGVCTTERYSIYINKCGLRLLDLFLPNTLFTILMRTQLTTNFLIWSALHVQNTLVTILKKLGKLWKGLGAEKKDVGSVTRFLNLNLLGVLFGVLEGVGILVMDSFHNARHALKILITPKALPENFVLPVVLSEKTAEVYCLNVAKNHNFFVNNVCVKNCDEELPENLFGELVSRLAATDGYFHLVFTATLGQKMWHDAMEGDSFPNAWKRCVSLYDCVTYKDGSPSPWTIERIKRREAMCQSEAEVQKRIHGRFIVDEAKQFMGFNASRNRKRAELIPDDWFHYSAIDIGSGGNKGHPAAIVFIAVRPDMKFGRVYKAWRGDGIETTAGDILNKYREMRGKQTMTAQYYDYASKDFYVIATRDGEAFLQAQKSHTIGENILNTLFRGSMLQIDIGQTEDAGELDKLAHELAFLKVGGSKGKKRDDLCDATRYAVAGIPWNFDGLQLDLSDAPRPEGSYGSGTKQLTHDEWVMKARRGEIPVEELGIEDEFDEWNEQYEH